MIIITPKQKGQTFKSITIVAVAILLIVGMSVLSYGRYHASKVAAAQQAAKQAVINQQNAESAAAKQAHLDADITRLIGICTDAQKRFDLLSKTEQAKTTRPNCAISQQ